MDFKQLLTKVGNTIKDTWDKNIIQRSSRIAYDVMANIFLFFVVIGLMMFLFAGGAGAGYFASLVKDEPLRDYDAMRKDIYNYEETSKLYFAGNKYIADVRTDLHREEIPLEKASELSIQAVLATEDQEFYEHNGVVPKAIVRALLQEVTNTDTKSGGSTLTQQLIKNQILTNEVSFDRKAKEILLAMRLENFFEKDEILEAYINIVPYGRDAAGRNIAGIQAAAKGIFDVDADALTLPQAAFIAGLPQNPYAFTPYQTSGEIKDEEGLQAGLNRMKTVLKRMYQNKNITEKEYNKALKHDIVADFKAQSRAPIERYPAVVFDLEKRANKIIMEILAEEDGYTMDDLNEDTEQAKELKEQYEILADRALRMNGYHIHSTIDKKIYDTMQKVAKDYPHYGPDRTFTDEDDKGKAIQRTDQVEVGASLIENNTGRVLGYIPGRNYSFDNQFNYSNQGKRSAGSTIKPLLVYGPGFDLGIIQPGSILADVKTTYNISGQPDYTPNNVTKLTYGLVSAREALTHSYNISTIQAYNKIIHENPAKNYLMKMGYKNINEDRQGALSLALGTTEVTVEDNSNSFAALANSGNFIETTIIDKITTADGDVIYEYEPEEEQVYSEQASYLTIDLLRDVMKSGTGTYATSQLNNRNVDWAGKTGTSQEYHDLWFIATNPNVTLGTWLGYDTEASLYCAGCSLNYSQRTQNLWGRLVNNLAEVDADLITPKEKFKQPSDIVSRSYCATSGLQPSKLCIDAGLVRSDIYNKKFTPNKVDDSLIDGNMALVEIDGELVTAGPDTPSEFTKTEKGGIAFNQKFLENMNYDKLDNIADLIPRRNPASGWSKISFDGETMANIDDKVAQSSPPKPESLKEAKKNIVWDHVTNKLIVGYRIYYAPEDTENFTLLTHTQKPSFAIPDTPGVYHVRAVNYNGLESEPSVKFIIEPEEAEQEEPEVSESESTEDTEKSSEKKNSDKGKDKKKNKDKD